MISVPVPHCENYILSLYFRSVEVPGTFPVFERLPTLYFCNTILIFMLCHVPVAHTE